MSVMASIIIVMMAVTNFHLSVTIAPDQGSPCAGTAAGVSKLHLVMAMYIVLTALTSLTHGQIALIAKKKKMCLAQVFLVTVPNFAMEMQHVQMLGMNYSQHANQQCIP